MVGEPLTDGVTGERGESGGRVGVDDVSLFRVVDGVSELMREEAALARRSCVRVCGAVVEYRTSPD